MQITASTHGLEKYYTVSADRNWHEATTPYQLIILDEAPQFIKDNWNAINEQTLELEGVFPLKGKNVIMCSATISKMYEKIIKEVLGCKISSFVRFPDAYEMIHTILARPNIRYEKALSN